MACKTIIQFAGALFLLFLTALSFYFSWGYCIPLSCVGLVDAYIILLLIVAAAKSDKNKSGWFGEGWLDVFPTRVFSLALFVIFLFIFFYAFGAVFYQYNDKFYPAIKTLDQSFYVSFQVLTTLGEGANAPTTPFLRHVLIFEVLSALNLLLGGLGLLVSRIADFKE